MREQRRGTAHTLVKMERKRKREKRKKVGNEVRQHIVAEVKETERREKRTDLKEKERKKSLSLREHVAWKRQSSE